MTCNKLSVFVSGDPVTVHEHVTDNSATVSDD